MSESSKAFLIILYTVIFWLCYYWQKEASKAKKLLRYYVDEGYECTNCMEGYSGCQCEKVREFLKITIS